MKQVCRAAQAEGRLIGLVPTMGALHDGHSSLVRAAQQRCSPVVVSIFVNPAQFGPNEDLANYPRQMERDRGLLEELRVDYLFAPTAAEIYPAGFQSYVNVDGLGDKLEGRSRPGHFRGVATVVLKLFEIARPQAAFFGRKDAQQARVIERMTADLNLDTEIVVCPTVREPGGLAMSSRNAYLSAEERAAATALSRSLRAVANEIARGERDALRLTAIIREQLSKEPLAHVDYAEIVDKNTLERVTLLRGQCYALLAAHVGKTRLLDNLLICESGGGFTVSL